MKWLRVTLPAVLLLLATAIALAARREPTRTEILRPKWDYKVIGVGRDIKNMESQLRELGADGWECVAYTFQNHSGTSGEEALVLKRQK
jgi:hypothetical protein